MSLPRPSDNPWTTTSTKLIYENPWIRVREDQVINPSGGQGIYGVVMFRNRAVGVVPVDDEDHTWLVGQYRYPHDTYEWEIPEGGCAEGEELLDCAKRELLEETGLVAERYELIAELQVSNSTTDEVAYLFTAHGLSQAEANPEDTEKLEVRRVPVTEAIRMAMAGEITDAMSVVALLKVAMLRK
ncbi:MAG: hydrolase [Verrucomicrobiaceae bacterium]|nr:hydrolase [Verrucomicrobiaceae bacterium]MDB6119801.1 hydrolase [Verrucomicrobiaceae bacterium]